MNKTFKTIYRVALFAVLPTGQLTAQSTADEALFRQEVSLLASNEYGGRKPLTEYETKTVNYIAQRFKDFGLQPVNSDSYFQKVPLLSVQTHLKNGRLNVKGSNGKAELKEWDDLVAWSVRGEKNLTLKDAGLVFVGFGINAPEYGWNDYEGIDVRGKIVVALVNDPGYYDDNLFRGKYMTYYGRWIYKFEEASRQGAAGVLVIHDTKPASYGFDVVQNSWGNVNLSLFSETRNRELVALQGWVTLDGAQRIFKASGTNFDEAVEKAKHQGFKAIDLNVRTTTTLLNDVRIAESNNVAAVLPGTDEPDKYVVYTAHWDHFGIGKPINGDSIYNGAGDNASGVAALLVLANKFTQLKERPRHSVMFLSVTAEEAVLLGSEYYTRKPLVPLFKTLVNINMDGAGPRSKTSDLTLNGAGDTNTDRLVERTAAAQGRTLLYPKQNTGGGYFRSDHFSFARAGVPVILTKGGRSLVNPADARRMKARHGVYHQPTDEYSPDWDVAGTLDDINLWFSLGLQVADGSFVPQWTGNKEYKQRREETIKAQR